jgi:hypothetical protein
MKIKLMNTLSGLIPLYDSDYDNKKKLKIGETYIADIKIARNIAFHRKYFALINAAWSLQDEQSQEFFHDNIELFRKTVQIAAGICEKVYSVSRKEWIEIPKSISFNHMDETEFNQVYNSVLDVLLSTFLAHTPRKLFNEILREFS